MQHARDTLNIRCDSMLNHHFTRLAGDIILDSRTKWTVQPLYPLDLVRDISISIIFVGMHQINGSHLLRHQHIQIRYDRGRTRQYLARKRRVHNPRGHIDSVSAKIGISIGIFHDAQFTAIESDTQSNVTSGGPLQESGPDPERRLFRSAKGLVGAMRAGYATGQFLLFGIVAVAAAAAFHSAAVTFVSATFHYSCFAYALLNPTTVIVIR
mmetsp:Transcript_40046/g.84093  ORF Transcript_40046/g.84093 Transcript_40046/m.84093 type:complete len:211 (-) Transcript_40046:1103-1735(-)